MAQPLRALLVGQPGSPRRLRRETGARRMTSVTLVRQIKARPQTVFDAMTRPELMARWWGPDAGPVLLAEADVRVGGAFRVRFRMLDGEEAECFGEYLEVAPPERLVFSWHWISTAEHE